VYEALNILILGKVTFYFTYNKAMKMLGSKEKRLSYKTLRSVLNIIQSFMHNMLRDSILIREITVPCSGILRNPATNEAS